MNTEMNRSYRHHHGKRRATPIPVLPPRIPTPMPSNNNNTTRSHPKDQESKIHPSSVGSDIPKLITKASYKLLDNDVKTAWINPRLISKIDMEAIKKSEYVPPPERNMNGGGQFNQTAIPTTPAYQKQQSCGRVHDREWETPVNGRAKQRSAAHQPVPASTQALTDAAKRKKPPPPATKIMDNNRNCNNLKLVAKNANKHVQKPIAQPRQQTFKGVVGYHRQSACYVGAGLTSAAGASARDNSSASVYGVYAETKYVYAVNGLPGNPAQASAAAAFFAR